MATTASGAGGVAEQGQASLLGHERASTVPAPAIGAPPVWPKQCGCGRCYSASEFMALPFVGELDDGVEILRLHNCACGSSLAIVWSLSPRYTSLVAAGEPRGWYPGDYGKRFDLSHDLERAGLVARERSGICRLTDAGRRELAALEGGR